MIQDEKDRLDCLKLAVSLFIPKNQIAPKDVAEHILKTARAFVDFIEDSGASANRIGHGNSTSDSEGSNPSALASYRGQA